jgi:hypothetical protein
MTKPDLMILYSSPEAASIKTLTGWVSRTGCFWGNDEHMARYDGSTHKVCDCGEIVHQHNAVCRKCADARSLAKYAAMERRPWDGDAMLFSDATDEYFRDLSEAKDCASDNGMSLAELRLIICEPTFAREIDGNDHFCDDLPEDGELPAEISDAFDALNEAIRNCKTPLSWSPGEYACEIPDDAVVTAAQDYILRRRRIRNLSKQLLTQEGPLPENGFDKTAEHNGLTLAANIISSMIGHEEQANPAPPVAEHDSSDTVRMDWLDAQDHIHALQWHCGNRGAPVKTSFYDRNRALIAEGISLRHAIDAAMQPQTEKGE